MHHPEYRELYAANLKQSPLIQQERRVPPAEAGSALSISAYPGLTSWAIFVPPFGLGPFLHKPA
jgi:hypothetical protein